MNLSRFKGELHYLFIPFILIVYAYDNPLVWLVIPIFLWRLYRYDKIFLIVCLTLGLFIQWRLHTYQVYETNKRIHEGIVTQVERNREHPRLRLKSDQGDFLVYHELIQHYAIGDTIVVKGAVDFPLENGFFSGFDYDRYLHSINISGIIYADRVELVHQDKNIYHIKGMFYDYIDENHPQSGPYLKAFILASRSAIDDQHYQTVQSLGIAHLFAVSGLHIGFMVLTVRKVLKTFIVHPPTTDLLLGIFLMGYLFITGSAPSVLRASVMFCLLAVNTHYKLKFSALDCVMALCIALLIIHPHFMYQVGFQLSFLVSITLVLAKKILKGKSLFHQSFIVSSLAFLISAPIIVGMQGSLNIMSVGFNVFYVYLMTFIMLPMAYITLIMPLFDGLMGLILDGFEASVHLMDTLLSLHIQLILPGGLLMVMYIIGVYCLFMPQSHFQRGVKASFLFGAIVVVNLVVLYSPFQTLTMYDVDGDAFLLSDRFNQCNILIDVGNQDQHNNLVRQLQEKNIRRIDYVLISHEHMDHYGAYPMIDKHFEINNTITNHSQHRYDNQWLQCGNIDFFILPSITDFGKENENSMIVKVKFMDQIMLFTGDIEQRAETEFIQHYDFEVDILKVAHHGSITSSSETFLDHINATKAFIPARRNNRFNHPSDAVIARLDARGINVYSLQEYGSVEFKTFGNIRFKKSALSP